MILKYYKFSTNYRNFPRSFYRETSRAPTPPPTSQRPYDVSRGQNRYVTLPLGEMTMACVPKAESVTNCPKMTTPQYRCFYTSLTPQSTTLLNFLKRSGCSKDPHTFQKECTLQLQKMALRICLKTVVYRY